MATFRETALENGFLLAVVPIARLADLRADIEEFAATQELNGFQKFVVSNYEYAPKEAPFEVKSVIVTASPNPSCGEVIFKRGGNDYRLYADTDTQTENDVQEYITEIIKAAGCSMQPVGFWFPNKRFAVQSGLAEYGRNNITYVKGCGSYITLSAFYTDMAPDEDNWRGVVTAEQCENCAACEKHCPMDAIRPGKFIIDTDLCLCNINEAPGEEFPPFVPKNAHHAIVGCMRCQANCPMNEPYNGSSAPTIYFSEAETERLLRGAPYDDLDEDFANRFKVLGMHHAENLPRNLRACFDIVDSGGECSLK